MKLKRYEDLHFFMKLAAIVITKLQQSFIGKDIKRMYLLSNLHFMIFSGGRTFRDLVQSSLLGDGSFENVSKALTAGLERAANVWISSHGNIEKFKKNEIKMVKYICIYHLLIMTDLRL
jgi:hypothetical protein